VGLELRHLEAGDGPTLARLYLAERAFLAPYEPERPESFFTPAGQRERIDDMLVRRELGAAYGFVVALDGEPIGTLNLSNVVRGSLQSANVGYWIMERLNGRGYATAAVGAAVERAFGELGLHRLEASTLVDNRASQRVLEKNEFERIGIAPNYLRIAGAWRDHVLFQRVAE
jgi:ribosomal-protein-alanine N-acetyltransferase